MLRKKTGTILMIILASIVLATSCATVSREGTQWTSVTSSPTGATVSVNGQPQGVTPLDIRLVRKLKGQVIRIESPGYNPAEIRVQRKMSSGPIVGNFLVGVGLGFSPACAWALTHDHSDNKVMGFAAVWGLVAGAIGGILTAIDSVGTGKGYELSPTELTVTLTKVDETPRVDTIIINADELQNIRWIRVRRE